ncbi:MAG: dihydropyrimidine dehydrogenase, partial [Ignavibacteriae bacterium]|nr:dihydropyrimidine dehydrogenase [Ignavibacteriota bacterium]
MSYQSADILSANAKKILNDYIHNVEDLKAKDRLKIPAQEMPAQDPNIRAHNLEEVAIGYTMEEARVEALRCLECVKQT